MLSTAKWCRNNSILSVSCHKNNKRNYFLISESISHISKERFLRFQHHFFNWNIIFLNQINFSFDLKTLCSNEIFSLIVRQSNISLNQRNLSLDRESRCFFESKSVNFFFNRKDTFIWMEGTFLCLRRLLFVYVHYRSWKFRHSHKFWRMII